MWRAVKEGRRSEGADSAVPTGVPRPLRFRRLSILSFAHSSTRSPRRVPAASAHNMPLPPVLRSLLRTTPTVAPVPHRAVLSITGSQAAEFLNGLTAASLPRHPHSHFYSAFLHAQVCRAPHPRRTTINR